MHARHPTATKPSDQIDDRAFKLVETGMAVPLENHGMPPLTLVTPWERPDKGERSDLLDPAAGVQRRRSTPKP